MSRFKASVKFIEEVREVVVDSFLKGFTDCKVNIAQAYPDQDLEAIVLDLPSISVAEEEALMKEANIVPSEVVADPSTPLAESREDVDEVPQHPGKAPVALS